MAVRCRPVLALVATLLVVRCAQAYYLPGITPVDYRPGASISVYANRLTSSNAKLPYSYYSIPSCPPKNLDWVHSNSVNLGQILVGERSFPTAYTPRMLQNETCESACNVSLDRIPKHMIRALSRRIEEGYSVRLNADNMPLITRGLTKSGLPTYRMGYKLGFVKNRVAYINNHVSLTILVNQPTLSSDRMQAAVGAALSGSTPFKPVSEVHRIVGFEAVASSHLSSAEDMCPTTPRSEQPQPVASDSIIRFTYSVQFVPSNQSWSTRWDPLLTPSEQVKKVQWFGIVNSLLVALFLAGMVAAILLRTLFRDFAHLQQMADVEESIDDAIGWKVLHGDVFRRPAYPELLSVFVGSGCQVVVMVAVTLGLALLGILSPANRGSLLTALISLYVIASVVGGFSSARLFSALTGGSVSNRKLVTLGSSFLFPGLCFTLFLGLNVIISFSGSSSAVPFVTLVFLLLLWFCVSVPLVFLGAALGYRMKFADYPTRTNQIPRQIPRSLFNTAQPVLWILSGMLPFGTVFMELIFVLNAAKQESVYYWYGALVATFAILMVTCAELSVILTYITLSQENWRWHWQAFASSAYSGVFVFLYAVYYMLLQPSENGTRGTAVAWLVYVVYTAITSGAFSLMCGCVGFFASHWFTRRLFRGVRVD